MSNPERTAGRRFDREHGVTTQAILFLEDLDAETVGDARAHATHYEAVPVADFHAMLACVPAEAIARSTFIDIGSGMGRAILLASEYPFKHIIGVEVSPSLHEIAKENIKTARGLRKACEDISVVRADARLWTFPPGDLVIFLYNPFDELTLEQTLGALVSERHVDDTVYVLYHTPVHEAALGKVERVKAFPFGTALRLLPYISATSRT